MNTDTDCHHPIPPPETSGKHFRWIDLTPRADRLVIALMLLYLLISPFTQVTSIKEICFYASVFLGLWSIALLGRWDLFRSPLPILMGLFCVWAIAGIPTALNKPNAIHDIYAHWIKYALIYLLLVAYFDRPDRFRWLAMAVVAAGGVYSVWYIDYFYYFLDQPWTERLVHFPYRDYSYVITLLLGVGLYNQVRHRGAKSAVGLAMAAALAALVLSQTRNALLAIIVGGIIYALKFRKAAIVLFVALGIGLAAMPAYLARFSWDEIANSDRITTNLTTWEIIKDHPVFGIGFGMQTYGYPEYIDLKAYHSRIPKRFQKDYLLGSPHNFLADTTVRTGIPGGLLLVAIYLTAAGMLVQVFRQPTSPTVQHWRIPVTACFAGFLVQSQFGDAAFGLQAIVFFTNLAMITILWRLHRQAQPDQR